MELDGRRQQVRYLLREDGGSHEGWQPRMRQRLTGMEAHGREAAWSANTFTSFPFLRRRAFLEQLQLFLANRWA